MSEKPEKTRPTTTAEVYRDLMTEVKQLAVVQNKRYKELLNEIIEEGIKKQKEK